MKKNLSLSMLICLLLPLCAAAQKHPQHIDLNQQHEDLGTGDQCVKEDNYSKYRKEIKGISPFYKAAKVVLVSFKNNSYQTVSNGDTTTTASRLPMHGDTVDYAAITQRIVLKPQQVDTLVKVLYDYVRRGSQNVSMYFGCDHYEYGVVLLDSSNKVMAAVAYCFRHGGFTEQYHNPVMTTDPKDYIGFPCEQKVLMIGEVFKKVGMKGIEIGE